MEVDKGRKTERPLQRGWSGNPGGEQQRERLSEDLGQRLGGRKRNSKIRVRGGSERGDNACWEGFHDGLGFQ